MNDKISEHLLKMEAEAMRHEEPEYKWAVQALKHYILSGRAPAPWIKAFISREPIELLHKVKKSGCDQDVIKSMTRILSQKAKNKGKGRETR